jgi:subtilisin family serine protease
MITRSFEPDASRPRLRLVVSLFLALCAAVAALAPATLDAQASHRVSTSISIDERGVPVASTVGTGSPAYHPSRALVHLRNGAPKDFLPGSGAARTFPGDPNLFLVENPPGLSVAEAVRHYRESPNVLYAEPDFVVEAVATPTDPLWNQQWDMAKISCPAAWDSQTDAGDVIVGILDTGIDFTHTDLQANLWTNPADGSHGFTCMNGTCVAGGSDDFGHGTHVAGTIGAGANDGIGIAGINWRIQLLSLKFLDSSGSGNISDAVLCFQKVTALKQQGFNIRLTSNSWGGGGFSQSLKDAMAQAEAAGVVHVCAAGNSGVNADTFPMYPAAYDNRGIVSVLASDQNDAGAYFTNYGLASVDIAAPGVSTLSTVPTGTCPLCDPSGYKFLSGTSMATPHVSGVLAALLHENPALAANEARDVLLDPGSYDALSDPRAQSTSTGGRLNFTKALANPLLFSPVLNNFPVLTLGPDVIASAGSQVNLTATASDPDNDPLRTAWAKTGNTGSLWLFGSVLDTLFPNPTGDTVSFTAPSLARTASVSYDASVADGRGGGAHSRQYVTVSPAPSPGLPPSGTLTVSPTDAPAGSTITVSFPATDPEGGQVAWDLWVGQNGGASGSCCFVGSGSPTTVTLDNAGVYRISTQAIDSTLNFSARQSAVVRIGGATGQPPIASATFDRQSGPAPLTVNIDMSASSDPDGRIQYYFFDCGNGGLTRGSHSSQGSCSYDKPGTYWLLLEVQDSSGNMDVASAYVVATPTTPPTVSITSPTPGATVSGNVSVTASASGGSGIGTVVFYRDAAVLLGTATASPYAITWDSSTASAGAHTLYATATDNAGNTGTSTLVDITVSIPTPPHVSVTSPTNGTTVPRKS